jgi:DNA-binding XRE family transcriptional regulator
MTPQEKQRRAQKIKRLRSAMNLTQADFAPWLGFKRQEHISRLESGSKVASDTLMIVVDGLWLKHKPAKQSNKIALISVVYVLWTY